MNDLSESLISVRFYFIQKIKLFIKKLFFYIDLNLKFNYKDDKYFL